MIVIVWKKGARRHYDVRNFLNNFSLRHWSKIGPFRIEFNLTHALLCCYRRQNFNFCSLGLFLGTGQLRFTTISFVWVFKANKCETAHLQVAFDLILSVPSSRMDEIKSTNFSYWLKSRAFSWFSVCGKATFSHPCASRKFNCRF